MTSRRAGFSLLEVMMAMVVLTVAILGMTSGILMLMQTTQRNRERTIAMNAARSKIDEMNGWPGGFSTLYAAYNDTAGDDPAGSFPAPYDPPVSTAMDPDLVRGTFAVAGLNPITNGGAVIPVGRIFFTDNESGQLFENYTGLPVRDYDGDGDTAILDSDGDGITNDLEMADVYMQRLGAPHDLDADGTIDTDVDHSTDYRKLPVLISIHWVTSAGIRDQLDFVALLGID